MSKVTNEEASELALRAFRLGSHDRDWPEAASVHFDVNGCKCTGPDLRDPVHEYAGCIPWVRESFPNMNVGIIFSKDGTVTVKVGPKLVRRIGSQSVTSLFDGRTLAHACLVAMEAKMDDEESNAKRDESDTKVVHILHGGLSMCGFSRDGPGNWPDGHVWVGLSDTSDANCGDCIACEIRLTP